MADLNRREISAVLKLAGLDTLRLRKIRVGTERDLEVLKNVEQAVSRVEQDKSELENFKETLRSLSNEDKTKLAGLLGCRPTHLKNFSEKGIKPNSGVLDFISCVKLALGNVA
ncbi:MAG: hypothetical protein F4093_07635 [Gammaproteobacteria bacterium]|nr:hypothetical protein [Gammaproteobacteria bacterium]